ncbi:MAG: phosphoadenylyl-sulfate reductase [Rhodospirillales bacterium]|nr:phosphoadenylyl-sulfate reductase [Rhodospirillales bacterium]
MAPGSATSGSVAESTGALLRALIRERFAGRIALVSSFGAESAVLLHMVAGIDPGLPVIFLDTGKLFAETLAYRDTLASRFGLSDIRAARADPAALAGADPTGGLWRSDPNRCCGLRKVAPLARALEPFDAWISGRKRFQGGGRSALEAVEFGTDWRIKINPLAHWSEADVAAYFARYDLPPHPLLDQGYRSIGCAPCTRAVRPGEAARAGRWHGIQKTECGIHRAPTYSDPPNSERAQA